MTTLRSRVGVAVVDRKLFAFGGYDGSSRLFTVECYDPEVISQYNCGCYNTVHAEGKVLAFYLKC